MIKSILGGKSKNLFDISKVVQSAQLKNNGNGTLTVSAYGVSAGILRDLCPNIKVGDTIKAYYTPISWTAPNPPRVIMISGHIMDRVANPSFVVTEADLNGKVYFYNNNYTERDLPGTTVIGNIFITNDTTVTAANYKDRYVPHELTSYKSIMKVSDGHFVTSFDERMPCKTKNLFSSSTEVGTLQGGVGGPTVTRNFEENKWYVGLTSNNYYNPGMIKEYAIKGGLIYFKRDDVNSNGYGLARAIKCEPSTTYTVSLEPIYVEKYCAFNIGYFDKNGNLVSTDNAAGMTKTITTPNNCNWIVFVLNFYDEYTSGKGKAYFCNIQLEKGTTATDYVPYGYV